jgi:hypothetical protein
MGGKTASLLERSKTAAARPSDSSREIKMLEEDVTMATVVALYKVQEILISH